MQEAIIKKGIANFTLVGKVKINDYTYQIDSKGANSNYIYNTMNLGVDCGNGNVVYGKMMGGYNPENPYPIYVHGKKTEDGKDKDDYKNRFQIDWSDRKDESILKLVGEDCFIRVTLEKDDNNYPITEKFLSEYDAIEYISKHLKDGNIIQARGKLEYNYYDGKIIQKKNINSIYLYKDETDEKTFRANFTQTFLITPESLDKKITEDNTMIVYGYVPEYVGKIEGVPIKKTVLMPFSFEFPLGRYTEIQRNFNIKTFLSGKKGWFSEIVVDGEFVEGVQTSEVTIDDLRDDQKIFYEMGIIDEDLTNVQGIDKSKTKKFLWKNILHTQTKNKDTGKIDVKFYNTLEKYKENEVIFIKDVVENSLPNDTSKDNSQKFDGNMGTDETELNREDLLSMFGIEE